MPISRTPISASAPGKIILFGEHAVVYARPAMAVPVLQVRAEAAIEPRAGFVEIDAEDIGRQYALQDAPPEDPIATMIERTGAWFGIEPEGFALQIRSTIPVARGLGSGAAVSVAIGRAIAKFLGRDLPREQLSALAFEVEKLHHGTPSGIDNTVIAFEQPVYFVRGEPITAFTVAQPFRIVIADTGVVSPTRIAVGDVRRQWETERVRYEALFDQIGAITRAARTAIEGGDIDALGPLMNANHQLAREIGVSSPEIEALLRAALNAGARGAKLSGAGRGGNVIALVDEENPEKLVRALLDAGARRVIVTKVEKTPTD
jgi:mevalonate kinase